MSLEKKTVVGIGNIYVETNYLGLVTNSPTLETGKEYRAREWEVRLGGSVANCVVQMNKLGVSVGLIGKVGEDEAGTKLLNLLKAANIATDLIAISKDPKTQTSIDTGLVFENGQNIQIVGGNANQLLSLSDINLDNPFFNTVGAVYLGGFLKQTSLYKDYPVLLQKLKEKGIQLFFDHGRIPVNVTEEQLSILKKCLSFIDGYFPNEEELLGVTGTKDLSEALDSALKMGVQLIAVKKGAHGCRIKSQTEDITIPGRDVKAVSTVGAGDAFNGGFISQYLNGKSLKESGDFANVTAALRVSTNRNPLLQEVASSLVV